jgi:hypothetical protein
MKKFYLLLIVLPFSAFANVMGISTHPLNKEARVLSAELSGYMSQRHEVGMGLRYTQEVDRHQLLDLSASGGQDSRSFIGGAGMDFTILKEDVSQPRISLKPYVQYMKFDATTSSLIGFAPSIRKGLSINGQEVFPYLAIPSGIMIDNTSNEFDFYSSLTVGASMPFPGAGTDKLLLSLEGNKNMGSSSDYVGCLVSWVWK